MGIVDMWAFIVASILLIISPGPGTLNILGWSIRSRRSGFMALAGTSAGDATLMALAALGVSALLNNYPMAFQVVKYAGGAYLVWLGIEAWRAREGGVIALPPTDGDAFKRGLMVTLSNPKAIVFFMAFFPQFVTADAGAMAFLILGGAFLSMNCLYQTILICSAAKIGQHLSSAPKFTKLLNRMVGTVFVAFGIRLAVGN
ncbi:leucine efflux protein [Chitinivorax tropicus]|uniref:Leucine efflux protein n=1 Tax=Chitinivorax tropicus TaxID=714531 RepID=A0A840ML98_9PROT|nr:LysE family transporter [Chitinivorax tropicus]MBB5019934.1 leucine efflux protein [Chitinivorax tropicus]